MCNRIELKVALLIKITIVYTLLLLLLTGTIFSYLCMYSITSILILAILIAIVLYS